MARRANNPWSDDVVISFDHASVSADTTLRIAKLTKPFRISKVRYVNETGLAGSGANFFNIKLLKGATVAANWSTDSGAQGTIAASTFVDMVLSATDADQVFAADDVMSLFLDETGTAALPAGRIVIEGRYV